MAATSDAPRDAPLDGPPLNLSLNDAEGDEENTALLAETTVVVDTVKHPPKTAANGTEEARPDNWRVATVAT